TSSRPSTTRGADTRRSVTSAQPSSRGGGTPPTSYAKLPEPSPNGVRQNPDHSIPIVWTALPRAEKIYLEHVAEDRPVEGRPRRARSRFAWPRSSRNLFRTTPDGVAAPPASTERQSRHVNGYYPRLPALRISLD